MNVPIQSPVCPSRSMALLSSHADTRKTPSGVSLLKARSGTGREWPGQITGPAPSEPAALTAADRALAPEERATELELLAAAAAAAGGELRGSLESVDITRKAAE